MTRAAIFLVALSAFAAHAQQEPLVVEHGVYQVRLLLHAIGTEEYSITDTRDGRHTLTSTLTTNDRGMKRASLTTLTYTGHAEPISLMQEAIPSAAIPSVPALAAAEPQTTEISATDVTVHESSASRTFARPPVAFTGFASMPAALQMIMIRYWQSHGQPARLPILRASPDAPPVTIHLVGHEAFQIKGKIVRLTRYTIANLIFGREILWMNDSNRVAAIMTFAGGLPQETVLDEYEDATAGLYHSGVRQQMLDLAELDRQALPEAQGTYAIVGGRLIDGTGAAPIEHATVVIRAGRIVSAGNGPAPAGMRIVQAQGKTLVPGLWEMHSHYSGVEFGPALLSAGVTTARDCGGELEFLTTIRRALDQPAANDHGQPHALGPRLVLAGLIDSGGPLAFGAVDVETPAEGIAAVDSYADNHFEQIKVYTQIKPDVLRAIAAEAHARGMTVTGHVPAAVDAFGGIDDGMDQINHLQFVSRAMIPPAAPGATAANAQPDPDSPQGQKLIALLLARHIVVDPTNGWGEMAGHPRSIETASFEPGVDAAPFPLASRFRTMGGPATEETRFRERMEVNRKVLHALIAAGVTIVPGSDTGLIGYGLDRELELYVQAGMTPMQALQSATIVSARVMRLDADTGSIEPGKRADLVLLNANPLDNISNLRQVDRVVTAGRLYSSRQLAQTVGFHR